MSKVIIRLFQFILTILAAATFTFQVVIAQTNDVTVEFVIKGAINGENINSSASMRLNRESGKFDVDFDLGEFPASFHPYAMCLSPITSAAMSASRSAAIPLADLAKGDYETVRSYTVENGKGAIIGAYVIRSSVRIVNENSYLSNVTIDGIYKGSTHLKTCRGYDLPMVQTGSGRIAGAYDLLFLTDDNEVYKMHVESNSIYAGDTVLAHPQVVRFVYHDVAYSGNRLTISGIAETDVANK
jgi:hypothetical protein